MSARTVDVTLRRVRRENKEEGEEKLEVYLTCLSFLLLLFFLSLLLSVCPTQAFSLAPSAAHTPRHTIIFSVMRERSAPSATQRGSFTVARGYCVKQEQEHALWNRLRIILILSE